jgi:hypothetical protein
MRLPILRLLCAALLLGAAMPLRASDILSRRMDVRFQQSPLKSALLEVAAKGGFEWSYSAQLLDEQRRVSLVARDWTVREILHALLGEGYAFVPAGNYLIIKKLKNKPPQISGYLRNPETGERIANATVYDRRSLRAVRTDSNGYYSLKVKKSAEIVITKLGFRDTIFAVRSESARFQQLGLPALADPPPPGRPQGLNQDLHKAGEDLARFFDAVTDKWHDLNVRDTMYRRFQVSLLPMLGTNHVLSGKTQNDWSLNVLAGHSMAVRRLEVGGLGNFTRKEVRGVQIAGLFNQLAGDNHGVQIAGIYNRASDGQGVQVAGIFNRTAGTLNGVQVAGLFNAARRGGEAGVQVAGLYNRCGDYQGLQIGGLANHADQVDGVQVAGLYNRAERVRGLQIGLINRAKRVRGLQIGLINRSGRRVLPLLNW